MMKGRMSPSALAVQFGPCCVRLLALGHHRRGIRVEHCREGPLPDGVRFQGAFDQHIKATCIHTLQSLLADLRLKAGKAVVAVDSRSVLLRRVPVDSWLEGDELLDQVKWEAEQLVVDPLDRYVVDFHVQDVSETIREVLLAVVRRNIIRDYVEVVEKAGLDPFCLDVDLFALSNAYEYATTYPASGLTALVDVDSGCVRCTIVGEGMFYFGRTREMESLPDDLTRLLDTAALETKNPEQSSPLARVVVSGREALSEAFMSDLGARCDYPIEVADPVQKESPAYMISMGLALRGMTET